MVEENFEIEPTQMLKNDSKNRIPPNYDFPPSRQNKSEIPRSRSKKRLIPHLAK